MKLLLKSQREKLIANYYDNRDYGEGEFDFYPVVKLIVPDTDILWLLTKLNPATNIASGLREFEFGCPQSCAVSLDRLEAAGDVRRDDLFQSNMSLREYYEMRGHDKECSIYWA